VNFLAHVLVAGDGPAGVALGAALPDLARMAGVRFDPDRLPPEVVRGVADHHRTDARFHGDPRFLAGAADLRRQAADRGLPPGAARAIGHAGWELLLDGVVGPQAADRFTEAVGAADVVVPAMPEDRGRTWWGLVRTLRDDRWWLRYDDPQFVAERLHGMTRSRPRLAFDRSAVPAVAQVLAAAQPGVAAQAATVVAAVRVRPAVGAGRHQLP